MTLSKMEILTAFHSKLGDLIVDNLSGKVTSEEVNEFYGSRFKDCHIAALLRRFEQIQRILVKSKTT